MRQVVGITGARPTSRARARSPASTIMAPGGSARLSQAATYGFQGVASRVGSSTGPAPAGSSSSPGFTGPGGIGARPRAQSNLAAQGVRESRAARNSRLSVVVRKRPMNRGELESKQPDVVLCRNSAVIVREPKLKVDLTRYVEEHNFLFDESFDETVTNQQLYSDCVRPIIDAVFQRAKCTCFAYGQTGSGKTFTMMGPPKRLMEGLPEKDRTPGIFLLAAQDIFRSLNSKEHSHLGVYIAFYEIYCGKLFDLLNNRQVLHARENAKANVVIVGLQEHLVQNVQELMEVIEYGLNSRTTGQTGANVDSSRSHAILQISLKDPQREDGEHGKISFIDLAGSERGADTLDTDRQTRMDGAEINKSLLALKECIRALDQQLDHTPFRGSKLTQVLKDSFVGTNCRTVMIANVSPCSSAVEHSLNTLRYAYRVKELRSASKQLSVQGDFGPPMSMGAAGELVLEEESSDEGMSVGRQTPPSGGALPIRGASAGAQGLASPRDNARVFQPRMSGGSAAAPPPQRPVQRVSHAQDEVAFMAPPRHGALAVSSVSTPPRHEEVQSFHGDARSSDRRGPGAFAADEVISPQADLDELARQHDRLIGTILAEEEELISAHRQHIDMMVELIKEEMVHLNNVDRPGSDVDAYVAGLDRILKLKAEYTGDIRQRVDLFKEHLLQEDALSRKFQSLASSS